MGAADANGAAGATIASAPTTTSSAARVILMSIPFLRPRPAGRRTPRATTSVTCGTQAAAESPSASHRRLPTRQVSAARARGVNFAEKRPARAPHFLVATPSGMVGRRYAGLIAAGKRPRRRHPCGVHRTHEGGQHAPRRACGDRPSRRRTGGRRVRAPYKTPPSPRSHRCPGNAHRLRETYFSRPAWLWLTAARTRVFSAPSSL